MRWFYYNYFNYSGGAITTNYYNAIAKPKIYNGVVFGTKNNPFYSLRNVLARSSVYNNAEFYIYYTSTANTRIGYARATGSASFTDLSDWGYRLVASNDDRNIPYDNANYKVVEYDSVQINGKYRTKSTVTPTLSGYYVPVDFYIGETKYNFFGNSDLSAGKDVKSNKNVIGTEIDGNIVTYSITETGSEILKDEYKNIIIDFGVGAEIPSFLYEWITENFEQIYDNNIIIKTYDGSVTLTELNGIPNIVKCRLSYVGNDRSLYCIGENGNEYTLNWFSEGIEGKTFSGLSLSANSKVLNIPVGQEININLSGNIQLYEVYGTSRPILTSFSINLYNNTAERNRVDKTNYITEVGTLNGVLRDESSLIDMVITFDSVDIPTFNYIYIETFNRYYFVNDISSIRYKLWEMSVSVDSLMTYKNAILACNGFIDRNEFAKNPYIIDNLRPVRSGNTVSYTAVTNDLFTTTQGTFILTGLGLLIDRPTESSEGGESNAE